MNHKIYSVSDHISRNSKGVVTQKTPEPLANHMVLLEGDYRSRFRFEELIHSLGDPNSAYGQNIINELISSIMLDSTDVNSKTDGVLKRLYFAHEWDRWVIDSLYSALEKSITQSVKNIVDYSDMQKVEGARRRLYNLAYIDRLLIHYWNESRDPNICYDQGVLDRRNREVHNLLMNTLDKTIYDVNADKNSEGYQLLSYLKNVFADKNRLNQYVYHRPKPQESRFQSTKVHGLSIDHTDRKLDEEPTRIYFWDWLPFSEIREDNFAYRVRKDAPTIKECRYRSESEQLGDITADFLGERIPAEYIEVVDPMEPWIGYPITGIGSRKEFMDMRVPEFKYVNDIEDKLDKLKNKYKLDDYRNKHLVDRDSLSGEIGFIVDDILRQTGLNETNKFLLLSKCNIMHNNYAGSWIFSGDREQIFEAIRQA
ncbi:MAG TPA: hypothetical protein DCS13_07330 [Candidatus Margulisbacteria bacterium]|nr:MAG: hypothetical protein A2X43_01345 [Candidatus Margulisbacteria bacterium GWD2_39_127]HAR63259.1 hypothetical protein [Candidatus Margulisiibacteriota bacterium]